MQHSDDNPLQDIQQLGENSSRKPYRTPVVEEFGQLSRVTQGSFSVGNDGAFGMSMNAGGGMGMGMGNRTGMGMGMGGFF